MHQILFRSHAATRILFIVLGVLVLLSLGVAFCHLVLHWRVEALTQLADVDMESNLPTFFNVFLFFIAGMLFFLHGKVAEGKHRRGWMLMALVFLFLGIDEGSQIHEKLMFITLRTLHIGKDGGDLSWFYYAWVIPYGLAVIALALALSRWLFHISPALRKNLFISGAVYVFGAIFLEMAGSRLSRTLPFQDASNYPWMPCDVYGGTGACWLYMEPRYILLYTLEETFEMTGLILCIRALLKAFEAKKLNVTLMVGEAVSKSR